MISTFKAIDANGDGQLTRDELIAGYSKIYSNKDEVEEVVDNIIKSIDHNNSGQIDFSGKYIFIIIYIHFNYCNRICGCCIESRETDEQIENRESILDV